MIELRQERPTSKSKGVHLEAPNPAVYSLVPPDEVDRALKRLELIFSLGEARRLRSLAKL
jgi:hypothetical protein